MTVNKIAFTSILPALILAVAGCESLTFTEPAPPCPEVAIVGEASQVTKFREGPGRDLIDVSSEGKITGFSGGCNYDFDGDTRDGVLTLEVAVDFNARLGPANLDHKARFNYFISVADADNNIVDKKVFGVEIGFQGNRTQSSYTDNDPPLTMEIPLSAERAGYDLNIYIGFQLSDEELEFNRYQRRVGFGSGY